MARDCWNNYRMRQRFTPELFPCRIPQGLSESEIDTWADSLGLGILEEDFDWLWVREWDGEKVIERPVYIHPELEQRIEGYFRLAWDRPELFAPSDHFPLILDRRKMLQYSARNQMPVGLVFENPGRYMLVNDLFDSGSGPQFYSRVIYADRQGNGTVIIPRLLREGAAPLFGIIHVYRHPIRTMAGGEFPRGFQAPGISPAENAAKELWEEFRITANHLTALTLLGQTRPDTGLSSGQVQIYLADISGAAVQARLGHEGIVKSEWITEEDLLARIRSGEILDGMTQTAMLFYQLHKK